MSERLSEQSPKSVSLLAVDDESANIFTLRCVLENEGYTMDACATGLEAVEKVRQNAYQLILLDVMLPDIDGYEVCKRVHQIRPEMPVILVTALSGSQDLSRGLDAGAIDYIKKPIDDVELLARVRNALRISQAEAQIKTLYNGLLEDLQIAARIQSHMLPKPLVRTDQLLYAAAYAPSDAIGGDLYDVIRLDEARSVVYIGDVSGHGMQAALVMSAVKYTLNRLFERAARDIQPFQIMNQVNQSLGPTVLQGAYVTLLLGILDWQRKVFVYHSAGHPSVLLYDLTGGVIDSASELGSVPIGWSTEIDYQEAEQGSIELLDHRALIFYTDGVTEYVDAQGEQLEVEGLKKLITAVDTDSCPVLLPQRLKTALLADGSGAGRDDFTILTLSPSRQDVQGYSADLMEIACQHQGPPITREKLLTAVGHLCRDAEAQVTQWCGDTDLAARVDILLSEVLNNIVVHGLADLHGSVLVEVRLVQEGVQLRCLDTGIAWEDPGHAGPEAELPAAEDLLRESGRGLAIVSSLASRLQRTRIGDINETLILLAWNGSTP